jgi:UDP-N-acetylmuramate--alanine ligase
MTSLADIKNIYFLGIGGIGMSALARYFKLLNKNIAGYDKSKSELTDELQKEGIEINFIDEVNEIAPLYLNKENTLIVYTPALPSYHNQLNFFKSNNFQIFKRSQLLGLITKNAETIAVCGTHGKTTTSSLVAHLFKHAGKNITAFLGGITQNYNSNLILGDPGKEKHLVVVEADEYDRSFHTLYPSTIICTSMDADHLDIYGTEEEMRKSYFKFFSHLNNNGLFIGNEQLIDTELNDNITRFTYGFTNTSANSFIYNLRIENGSYVFNLNSPFGTINDIEFPYPGLHNIENAVGAVTASLANGLNSEEIKQGLKTFKGVRRRFDIHIRNENHILIDDYAHHPKELSAFIHSVKNFYPNKVVTGIFQPHLFSRTRDFGKEFGEALSMLDMLYLLDIYPAREEPISGINSAWLANFINGPHVKLVSKSELIKLINITKPELLLTIGAGDIDQLIPQIKIALEHV